MGVRLQIPRSNLNASEHGSLPVLPTLQDSWEIPEQACWQD